MVAATRGGEDPEYVERLTRRCVQCDILNESR